MTQAAVAERPKVGLGTKLAYGVGSVAYGAKNSLMGALLFYYSDLKHLPAHWVSLALAVSVVVDALWDPTVGQVSDTTTTRLGRRHPFMYFAAAPVAICFALLWNPPNIGPTGLIIYMSVLIVVLRMVISLYEVPNSALAPELAPNYDERTSLLAYRYLFGTVGGAAVTIMGLLVFLHKTPEFPLGQKNVAAYGPYAITVAVIMFASILASTLGTHNQIPFLRKPPRTSPGLKAIVGQIVVTLTNRNFVVLALSGMIFGVSNGLGSGLQLYFTTYLWELPTNMQAVVLFGGIFASIAGVVAAPIFAKRFGKKQTCITLFFLSIFLSAGPIALRLFDLMPPNGSAALVWILTLDRAVAGGLGIMGFIIVSSMIADIVEESEVKTGRRSEGLLMAADTFLQKVAGGVATMIPGLLLTLVAFPTNVTPGNPPAQIMTLAWIYLPITVGLNLCSTSLIFFYRIDRKQHEENLRKLAESAAIAETADPDLLVADGAAALTRPI